MEVYVFTGENDQFWGVFATEERAKKEMADNPHLNGQIICEEVLE